MEAAMREEGQGTVEIRRKEYQIRYLKGISEQN